MQSQRGHQYGWPLWVMEVLFTLGDRNLILNVNWGLWNTHLTVHNSILQTSAYADAFLSYGLCANIQGKKAALGFLTSWQAALNSARH